MSENQNGSHAHDTIRVCVACFTAIAIVAIIAYTIIPTDAGNGRVPYEKAHPTRLEK